MSFNARASFEYVHMLTTKNRGTEIDVLLTIPIIVEPYRKMGKIMGC